MTRNEFLDELKDYMEDVFKDSLLPTKLQKTTDTATYRAPVIYSMRLPDSKQAYKKVPYIINRIVTSQSVGRPGEDRERTCDVDTVFAVYCEDETEGARMLIQLFDKIEFDLINAGGIGGTNGGITYELIREQPIEFMIYPEDTAPYFMGEMMTHWRLPPIEQEMPKLWNPTYL